MRVGRLLTLVAIATATVLPSASIAEAQIAPGPTPRGVSIFGRQFTPQKMRVPLGTTITWTNGDRVVHNVRSVPINLVPGPIQSPAIAAKDGIGQCNDPVSLATCGTFAYTFTATGTYAYVCTIHRRMAGTVTVFDTAPPPAPVPQPPPPPPPPPGAQVRAVSIMGTQFNPRIMRIKEGDSIFWQNGSSLTHTISPVPPVLPLGAPPPPTWAYPDGIILGPRTEPDPGQPLTLANFTPSEAITFPSPGRYDYICRIHPRMAGMIVVSPVTQ